MSEKLIKLITEFSNTQKALLEDQGIIQDLENSLSKYSLARMPNIEDDLVIDISDKIGQLKILILNAQKELSFNLKELKESYSKKIIEISNKD